ncbi:4Fe-4S dicluster domain-containing protein [Methanocalculus taiwanensis]|uniref:4Fe-4S dicluster domain-containing protein n=1 Tax=Methanocalculus taiwanensis TaxID=106207 RepID=A0ABD4TQN4_9EURY|nr:4Fe-4S binding protein [Methanocalculus taiwanensis]MCQ1539610.1 4Fe-4S dicluster domain-containing protein [Methanocalculus taiwanensis]
MSNLFPKFSRTRDGVKVVMEQRLLQQTNHLILDSETCTGCGICVEACPEEAISLGLVGAVRRGAVSTDVDAPVSIEAEKCSYCGVCVIMCPFNALTLEIDGEEKLPILEKEGFPQYDMVTEIDDEKCVRCTICDEVCPREAIDRDVPLFEGADDEGLDRQKALTAKTEFTVDDEKCNLCGICGALCPAIMVEHKPFTPATGTVEGEVVWNEDLCDACQVCVEACPEEAITVVRTVESKKLPGKVTIVSEDCCTCTWCSQNCPEEAITVEKIFEGDITFNAEKCPSGCSTCVEVCPCNAIYLPTPKPAKELKRELEPVIAVNKDYCMLCGACVNACPGEDIIVLKRTGIRVKGKETDLFKTIKAKLLTSRTSQVREDVNKAGEVQLKRMETA